MGSNEDSKYDFTGANLLDLYSVTYAPLGETLLGEIQDLGPEDMNTAFVLEELEYTKNLVNAGLSGFHDLLRKQSVKELGDEQSVGAALVALSAFLKRSQSLLAALAEATGEAASSYDEGLSTLREYEESVKEGNRPTHPGIDDLVNLTPNMKWESPSAHVKSKVGFKDNIVVFGGTEETSNNLKEEPLKSKGSDVKRSQRRHPTGFARFSFKPEDLEDSDDGGSTGVSRSRVDSDDQRSVASTAGNSQRQGGGNDDEPLEEMIDELNPFRQGKRSSSVGFSFDHKEEIQVNDDQEADPNWSDEKRHERRFSRIRNRVPTGHPTIMKAASDELSGLLEDYEKQMTGMSDDYATLANTTLNRGENGEMNDDDPSALE